MTLHPFAGKPAPPELYENIPRLVSAYYTGIPNPDCPGQKVTFGTSGHRGSSLSDSFNENHVLAIVQATYELRKSRDIAGPVFLGKDTHALSESAFRTALEVLAGNEVDVMVQKGLGYTPTPVISHAIIRHNLKHGASRSADGLIATPSHNPPSHGGLKYNPPTGGPADSHTTNLIQDRANEILKNGLKEVRRVPFDAAMRKETVHKIDYIMPYINDLSNVIDIKKIRQAGLKIGVDPMGGAGIEYWEPLAEAYGLDITVVNELTDAAFSFMNVDWDGKIRMDCSSPYAMAGLIKLKDEFDIAFGNDPDFDRHGIVTGGSGLLNPNHYLAAAVHYLFRHRTEWSKKAVIGKTLVSSSMIDRVADSLGRDLFEVPVGFKWFVQGLGDGACGFGGEESAGASFLRKDGTAWTTDKDGIILDLLAAEITAVTGRDPGEHYRELTERFGSPVYERIDAPATPEQKSLLKNLSTGSVTARELAGERIIAKLTDAPGNGESIGGLKVVTENGWFAARPSGTEAVYKIYAESFRGSDHLRQLQEEARTILDRVFG